MDQRRSNWNPRNQSGKKHRTPIRMAKKKSKAQQWEADKKWMKKGDAKNDKIDKEFKIAWPQLVRMVIVAMINQLDTANITYLGETNVPHV